MKYKKSKELKQVLKFRLTMNLLKFVIRYKIKKKDQNKFKENGTPEKNMTAKRIGIVKIKLIKAVRVSDNGKT